MLTKSLSLTSDNVTYDLEDSVTPHEKPNARQALAKHLSAISLSSRPTGIGEVAARINAVSTPYALEDLQTLGREPGLEAIVVPKVNRASDLTFVSDVLKHVAPQRCRNSSSTSSSSPPLQPIKLLALIESAEALLNLGSICQAGVSDGVNLSGLIFAAEDFSLDLSLTRTPSLREFLFARSAIATHARGFGLPSTIDLVCTTFRGEEGTHRLREECADGKGMGFNGKQCIHPSQVEVVQEAFAPSGEELEWSVRVVVADEKASKGDRAGEAGRGAWTLDGKMIDAPVVGRAKAVIARADRCGFDVNAVRERWKDQEPE
jgi:citrate lyase subunit beta-like protein